MLDEFAHIEQIVVHDLSYSEMLEDLRQKILYLSDLKTKALDRQKSLTPSPVFPYGDAIAKLPTTLSELFAIEQQKIELRKSDMIRGKQLDEVIEQELQMMLVEGFEKSPISHKALHSRLNTKGFISGGLSIFEFG